MAAIERTYSFRAAGDLGERMRDAAGLLKRLRGDEEGAGAELAELVANELVLALLRDSERLGQIADNQSAFMREALELLVAVTEKIENDQRWAREYAALEQAPEESEFRAAGKKAGARRWRDA
jgi:hypothetical protein